MSWEAITLDQIKPSFQHGIVFLKWICPRCDGVQMHNINFSDLIYGTEITCLNTSVCGERQAYFVLKLEIEYGSQKGLLDRPLEEKER